MSSKTITHWDKTYLTPMQGDSLAWNKRDGTYALRMSRNVFNDNSGFDDRALDGFDMVVAGYEEPVEPFLFCDVAGNPFIDVSGW